MSAKGLRIELVEVLHEGLIVVTVMHGRERMAWKKKGRPRNRNTQNLRGFPSIGRISMMSNARVGRLWGVKMVVHIE